MCNLGQQYFWDSVGRTEQSGKFGEELIYLDKNSLRSEPQKEILTSPLVTIRQEGRRTTRQGEPIDDCVKEREGKYLFSQRLSRGD